jgi:hypothetical protein
VPQGGNQRIDRHGHQDRGYDQGAQRQCELGQRVAEQFEDQSVKVGKIASQVMAAVL